MTVGSDHASARHDKAVSIRGDNLAVDGNPACCMLMTYMYDLDARKMTAVFAGRAAGLRNTKLGSGTARYMAGSRRDRKVALA